jgi:hypothetical protein
MTSECTASAKLLQQSEVQHFKHMCPIMYEEKVHLELRAAKIGDVLSKYCNSGINRHLGNQKHQIFQDSLRIDREILSLQLLRPASSPDLFQNKGKENKDFLSTTKCKGTTSRSPLLSKQQLARPKVCSNVNKAIHK